MVTNNSIDTQSPIQVVAGGTGQNTYLDGQLLIGNSTGNTLAKATLTAGSGISITNGSGTISIASTGGSFSWTEITTNTNGAINTGYITNSASRIGVELPSTAAQGSILAMAGKGAGGWNLAPNVGQTIYNGAGSVTYPGFLQSTNAHDCVNVVNITANTEFDARNFNGTINNVLVDFEIGNSLSIIKSDGSVWACGDNSYGQLGNLTRTSYSSPIAMVGNHSFIGVSGSPYLFYGLKSNGSVWCCGDNAYGQLGQQNVTSYSSPVQVVGNHSFIQISAYYEKSFVGLKADGSLWVLGRNDVGQL